MYFVMYYILNVTVYENIKQQVSSDQHHNATHVMS